MTDRPEDRPQPTEEERLRDVLGVPDAGPAEAHLPDGPDDPVTGEVAMHDPEAYSMRSPWLTEAERLEAAEFLVATRAQHERRQRSRRVLDLRRAVMSRHRS